MTLVANTVLQHYVFVMGSVHWKYNFAMIGFPCKSVFLMVLNHWKEICNLSFVANTHVQRNNFLANTYVQRNDFLANTYFQCYPSIGIIYFQG